MEKSFLEAIFFSMQYCKTSILNSKKYKKQFIILRSAKTNLFNIAIVLNFKIAQKQFVTKTQAMFLTSYHYLT